VNTSDTRPGDDRPPRFPWEGLAYDDAGRLLIDVRGPRFASAVTALVLAAAFIGQWVWLVAFQTAVFAVGTIAGLRWSPYGNVFRLIKRRFELGPAPEAETEGPPRFAQLCGLVVSAAALVAFALGAPTVGWALVGVVLALATLLAATGICVGCEMYLLGQRVRAGGGLQLRSRRGGGG
jgi:hypothetical protein